MTQPTNTTQFTEYYGNLLIKEFITQPKAYATIELLAYMGLMPQDGGVVTDNEGDVLPDNEGHPITVLDPDAAPILPLAITSAFNIQTAVGQQLQFLAESVGVTNFGFNLQGQLVILTDAQFRILLQAASGRNYLTATLPAIMAWVLKYFSAGLQVFDNLNMSMTYYYSYAFGSNLPLELLITAGLLPRPLGVKSQIVAFGYDYFGFLEDPNGDTFGDINNPVTGGYMPMILNQV